MSERVVRSGAPMIGVIGGGSVSAEIAELAKEVGRLIGGRGGVVVCGGLGGVMAAACAGAHEAGGVTVGILPGEDRREACADIDIPIVTGMRQARNIIVARTASALIAIDGSYGTLSEIAFGLHFDVPVVALGSWNLDHASPLGNDPIHRAQSPQEAVALAFDLAVDGTSPLLARQRDH